MYDDTPMILVLLLLGAGAWWIVKRGHRNVPVAPDAPSGQPIMPLAPYNVSPPLRWLLLPSQEE
jgi:hypothetical protein